MADDAPSAVCKVCGSNDNLKRCSRCKCVLYCSRDHQSKHWRVHKTECARLAAQSGGVRTRHNQTSSDKGRSEVVIQYLIENKAGLGADATGFAPNDKPSSPCEKSAQKNDNKTKDQSDDPFIEFDSQPFKNQQFDPPPSFDFEDLAKYITTNLKSNSYCVIDGLFETDLLSDVKEEFEGVNESGQMTPGQLSGGITSGEDELKVTKSEIRSDKLAWVEGTESNIPSTCKVISTMDDIIGRFNQYLDGICFIKGRTKAMMACYPGNGSFYRRHVDNPNKDGRVITCILYLNSEWDVERDGGMLRILPEGSEDHVDIAPILNRLLVFWSDRRNPHEVHPAYRTRYALTVWYFDAEERLKAKEDRVNEEMSRIRGELSLLEVKTKEAEKENISQKIANESMKAVAGLSEEELDVIAHLVKGHPDPAGALSSLGIAASIRDALLNVLRIRNT